MGVKGKKSLAGETPVRVVPGKGRKHRTETRIFARENWETWCVQPGCRFKGQHAQQGICHTTEPFASEDGVTWASVEARFKFAEKAAKEELDLLRKQYKGRPKRYVGHLEAAIWCNWVNVSSNLDELIRLRAENAVLKDKLARRRRR